MPQEDSSAKVIAATLSHVGTSVDTFSNWGGSFAKFASLPDHVRELVLQEVKDGSSVRVDRYDIPLGKPRHYYFVWSKGMMLLPSTISPALHSSLLDELHSRLTGLWRKMWGAGVTWLILLSGALVLSLAGGMIMYPSEKFSFGDEVLLLFLLLAGPFMLIAPFVVAFGDRKKLREAISALQNRYRD